MDSVVALVSAGVPGLSNRKDDDMVDRLSSKYTVIMILVFSAVITLQLYLGSPLTCWAPVHFTYSHMMYANSYCWVKNTYYLPFDKEVPKPESTEHANRQVIPYYQWIPFILLIQALLFFLPSVVWHGLNQQGGIDADNILQAANLLTIADKEDQREGLKTLLANQMDRFLGTRRVLRAESENVFKKTMTACCGICGRRFGAYLVILYMVVKVLYVVNVIAQFFILNSVLGTSFNSYGFQVMKNMVRDDDWTSLPNVVFPRVTMCDFSVRRLGNLHRYTVQCALRINMYNEKIYVFLWFWFFVVAFLTVLFTLVWLFRFVFKSDRRTFIRNHLELRKKLRGQQDPEALLDEFVFEYLKQDGVFLLRLISHNTNSITTTDITCSMWDSFLERRRKRLEASNPPTTGSPPATGGATVPSAPKEVPSEKKPLIEDAPVKAKIESETNKNK